MPPKPVCQVIDGLLFSKGQVTPDNVGRFAQAVAWARVQTEGMIRVPCFAEAAVQLPGALVFTPGCRWATCSTVRASASRSYMLGVL